MPFFPVVARDLRLHYTTISGIVKAKKGGCHKKRPDCDPLPSYAQKKSKRNLLCFIPPSWILHGSGFVTL